MTARGRPCGLPHRIHTRTTRRMAFSDTLTFCHLSAQKMSMLFRGSLKLNNVGVRCRRTAERQQAAKPFEQPITVVRVNTNVVLLHVRMPHGVCIRMESFAAADENEQSTTGQTEPHIAAEQVVVDVACRIAATTSRQLSCGMGDSRIHGLVRFRQLGDRHARQRA
jgi:hypothetical protein